MPSYQGELDGLCGPYAIANALEQCGLGDHHEAFFHTACATPTVTRWPEILWQGTTFGDLQRMLSACLKSPANKPGLRASYPFRRVIPTTNQAYWDRFDDLFDDDRVVCAIIGITKPSAHWIVASRDGGRILFTNSTAGNLYERKNRASLFAGQRRKRPGQWLIERSELVALRYP